jgi:hypothetical protein
MVGDVWDALDGAGFQVTKVATGRRLAVGPSERTIFLHGKELVGGRIAAQSLLETLASWGIRPVASGTFSPPPNVGPSWQVPYAALPQQPLSG